MNLAALNPFGQSIVQCSRSENLIVTRLKRIIATIHCPKITIFTFLPSLVLFITSASVTADDDFYKALQEDSHSFLPQMSSDSEQPRATPPQLDTSRKLSKQSRQITLPGQENGTQLAQPGSIWRTIGALLAVITLILVGAKLWKKQMPVANTGLPNEAIEVLGRKSIEPRLSVYLIRCGSRILVVGSSADGLQTLSEVTDPVEVDYLAGICRQPDQDNGFAQSLRTLFHRQSSPSSTSEQSLQSFDVDIDEEEKTIGQLNIEPSTEYAQKSESVHA